MSNIGLTEWECREIAEEAKATTDDNISRAAVEAAIDARRRAHVSAWMKTGLPLFLDAQAECDKLSSAIAAIPPSPVEGEGLREALKAVEPYLDAIICYASTMDEHEGNAVAVKVRAALSPQSPTGETE